jgi:hypothetical protein
VFSIDMTTNAMKQITPGIRQILVMETPLKTKMFSEM